MIHVRQAIGAVSLLLIGAAPDLLGQRTAPAANTRVGAFGIEALGGTVGSAVGIGLGLAIARPNDCPADDVACTLQKLGATGIIGVAGATIGTVVAGRSADTKPSAIGAFLGAAAGLVAAIGLEHLITEEMNQTIGNAGTLVLFSVTQGILAAAGSRLVP